MKYTLYILLLPFLLTYSCSKVDSSDLKEDVPYYQDYTVSYDKTSGSTSVMASFKIREASGTRVDLANGAGVSANSATPTTDFLDKTLYRWNFSGLPDMNFVLTKNSGVKINNTALLADISNIDFASSFPVTASKSSGISFNWTGDAIAGTETMHITISTPDSGSTKTLVLTKNNTSNTVVFSPIDLLNVKQGTATIEMIRYKSLPLDNSDGTSGGGIGLRYYVRKTLLLNP